MAKSIERPARQARKAGARRITRAALRPVKGIAGRPLRVSRQKDRQERHAVRQRPKLRERLAARVKQETRRLEPPTETRPAETLAGLARRLREAILPNDPRDMERREQSGEPVVALVGAVDLMLLLAVVVLLVVGTVMVYSASLARSFYDTDFTSTSYYLIKQTEWLLFGIVGMYVALRMDYRRWRYLAGPALVVSVVLLLLLHTRFGVTLNGARRWLIFGPIDLQPSEVAKMGLMLYAAHWFAGQRDDLRHSLRGLVPFGLVVGGMTFLVLKQPDLGTTIVIVISLFTIYFVAGARWQHLALLAIAGAIGVKLYLKHIPAYQLARFTAWLHPSAQALKDGYHYLQLQYALGMGGLTGVGLGQSQSKYTMPNPHTDSIFAIIGEEWGLVGTLCVIAIFLLFAWRGLRASILAPDRFGRLLATGITCSIVFQALLNMAVAANAVPFTGVPLPFISYGGSSLSISMAAAGILLNISKYALDLREEPKAATTYFWRGHRRTSVPLAGGDTPPLTRAALSASPRPGASARRPVGR